MAPNLLVPAMFHEGGVPLVVEKRGRGLPVGMLCDRCDGLVDHLLVGSV
jgi:hypothetical protein